MSDPRAGAPPHHPTQPDSGIALDNLDPESDNGTVVAAGRQRVTHMGFARALATALFIVALPVVLITTNVRLLANSPAVYDYAFDRYDGEAATGLSRADLDKTAAALRDYFNNGEKTFYSTVTQGGLSAPVFGARETQHMEDVKQVFVWVNRIQEIAAVYVLAYVVAFFIWARDGHLRQLAAQALAGVALGILVVGALGAVAAFGFDAAFTRFHEILFRNDLWQLNPETDHLIQMFPEEFWRDVTVMLGVLSAMQAVIIAAIAGLYLLSTRPDDEAVPAAIDVGSSSTQAA
jgi:integral membrane protein (TIGR01906 family)